MRGGSDFDLNQGTITVLHGKGDRRRTVGIDPAAVAFLSRWVDRRKTLQPKRGVPLFCTLQGGLIHPSYVRTLLPRLAAKAGIDKRVHPHGLRHTMAFELMMEGVPVPIIQKQLGHANLATTQLVPGSHRPEGRVRGDAPAGVLLTEG